MGAEEAERVRLVNRVVPVAEYRCTATATATPFVRMALDAAHTDAPDVSSMRFWLCAGAPIPEAPAREFGEVFTGGQLVPLYARPRWRAT